MTVEPGVVYVCEQCQHEDELSEQAKLTHQMVMIEDYAMLQAMTVVHGNHGMQEFFRVGGVVHLPAELVQGKIDQMVAGKEEE